VYDAWDPDGDAAAADRHYRHEVSLRMASDREVLVAVHFGLERLWAAMRAGFESINGRIEKLMSQDDDILAGVQAIVPIVTGLEATGAKLVSGIDIIEEELANAGGATPKGQQALALLRSIGAQLTSDGQKGAALAASLPSTPVVASIAPTSGTVGGGTPVVITGAGFFGATAVNFGTVPGTALSVISDTQVQVTSPPGAAPGPVDVTVVTPNGTSAVVPADSVGYV
jgi:hypothetical protein